VVCAAATIVLAGCRSHGQPGAKAQLDSAKVEQVLRDNLPLLASVNKDERIKAAQALGELGEQGKKAVPDLAARISDAAEDPAVVQAAQAALCEIAGPSVAVALAASYSDMRGMKNEMDALNTRIAAFEKALYEANMQLDARREDAMKLQAALVDAKNLAEALQARNRDCQVAMEKLNDAARAALAKERRIAELESQVADLQKEIKELQATPAPGTP
jgi:chromosome segregation ATPase